MRHSRRAAVRAVNPGDGKSIEDAIDLCISSSDDEAPTKASRMLLGRSATLAKPASFAIAHRGPLRTEQRILPFGSIVLGLASADMASDVGRRKTLDWSLARSVMASNPVAKGMQTFVNDDNNSITVANIVEESVVEGSGPSAFHSAESTLTAAAVAYQSEYALLCPSRIVLITNMYVFVAVMRHVLKPLSLLH